MPQYSTCLLYHLVFPRKTSQTPPQAATSRLERTMPLRYASVRQERTTLAVEDARSLLTRLMPFVEGGGNQS